MSYREAIWVHHLFNVIIELAKNDPQGVMVFANNGWDRSYAYVFDALKYPCCLWSRNTVETMVEMKHVRIADYYTHIELVEELIRSYSRDIIKLDQNWCDFSPKEKNHQNKDVTIHTSKKEISTEL